jgi:hypothetical protein
MSGVESGKAAPLVGGPPGAELHTVVEELPTGAVGEMFPVVEMTMGAGMVPNPTCAVGDIVGANVVIVAVLLSVDVVTALGSIDDVGAGTAAIEGAGSGGSAGGGSGTIVPG